MNTPLKDKKGRGAVIIGGPIIAFLVWLFLIGPILETATEQILESLGDASVCPQEFSNERYKICFNAQGDVIADGKIDDSLSVGIDGHSDSCHIRAGDYDFEYAGCRIDQFEQLEAYNILLISKTGRVSLSGKNLLNKIATGSEVVKIIPKGFKWVRRLLPFIRFA